MKPNILTFGEIIWDIYGNESIIGGAGLNFSAHCSLCGANSFLFSAVGDDDLGQKAKNIILEFNINQEFIKETDKQTGKCIVTLDGNGNPGFSVVENTAYDNIMVSDDDVSRVNEIGFDALYFGTLIQRNQTSRQSLKNLCQKCNFKEIICDVNLRKDCYDRESARFCLENATILKVSEDEELQLRTLDLYNPNNASPKSICKAICEEYKQIKYIIFTRGEKGAFIYCAKSKKYFTKRAKSVKVVSTVGAGDSFIASWVTSYLCGKTPKVSTKLATELSGYVVSKKEAIPFYSLDQNNATLQFDTGFFDMHVHSKNSHDGKSSVKDIAKACIRKSIKAFAVTDHCDIQYYTERDMPSCIKNSIKETQKASKKFNKKVQILKGIEIGEGIWNKQYTDEILKKYDYDVVIGSVHAVRYKNYTAPYSVIDFSKMTKEEIDEYLEQYFDDVLEMLQEVDCDIMAHLTCPLRYINGKYNMNADVRKYKDKITKILEYIITHSIALEVNTSGVGTSYDCFMPDEWIIKEFGNMGGYLLTLGSDAHVPKNVGVGFEKAIKILKENGYKNYYYYKDRKPVECKI